MSSEKIRYLEQAYQWRDKMIRYFLCLLAVLCLFPPVHIFIDNLKLMPYLSAKDMADRWSDNVLIFGMMLVFLVVVSILSRKYLTKIAFHHLRQVLPLINDSDLAFLWDFTHKMPLFLKFSIPVVFGSDRIYFLKSNISGFISRQNPVIVSWKIADIQRLQQVMTVGRGKTILLNFYSKGTTITVPSNTKTGGTLISQELQKRNPNVHITLLP